MNKQPFYHTASVLFTATREVSQSELEAAIRAAFKARPFSGVLTNTIVVESLDNEPGDPADLM